MPDAALPRRSSFRILKYTLVVLGVLVLLAAGAIAYLIATFDPRDYHDRIVELVREKTGRTLEVKGEIGLSFWPDVAVRLGEATLSERATERGVTGERDGGERFVDIESARITLKLLPLLERELVASEFAVTGANVRIKRYADGSLNIDDLLKGEGAAPRFDIGKITVERSTISYQDFGTGDRYELTEVAIRTERLANTGTSPIALAFVASDAPGTFRIAAKLGGTLELDLEQQRYGLRQASLELKGSVPGMPALVASARGDELVQRKTHEAQVSTLSVSLTGTHGADAIAATIEASKLSITAGVWGGEAVRVAMSAKGPAGSTEAKLSSPSVTRKGDRITSDAAALELALVRGEHTMRAALSTPLAIAIGARELALGRIDATFSVLGPRLPRKGVIGTVRGEARVNAAKEAVQTTLSGKVGESNVKARLSAAGFAAPVYTFAVEIDELDLNRYIAADTAGKSKPARPAATAGESLLRPLVDLPATGTVTVGVLKSADVKADNVRLVLK
jgi:AsmA protein